MKLVFIHGISQENFTEDELRETWKRLVTDQAPGLLDKVETVMPYYGKELASWSDRGVSASVAMGVSDGNFDPVNNEELNFLVGALQQTAVARHVSDDDIDEQSRRAQAAPGVEAVPMSTWIGRRLVGVVRALEAVSPLKGAIALQVFRQAYTYLANPSAGMAVDALVKPRLSGSDLIIVSHSLGTVIAFKLLREMEAAGVKVEVPLLITLGSPLGLDAVKSKLGPPRKKPASVKRWINFYDPGDFVALGIDLDQTTFAQGIENVGDVNNTTANAHGIIGYLPEKRVIAALRSVL